MEAAKASGLYSVSGLLFGLGLLGSHLLTAQTVTGTESVSAPRPL